MVATAIPDWMSPGHPAFQMLKMIGPFACGLLIAIWWLVASRARTAEKGWGLVGIVTGLSLTLALVDRSMFGIPILAVTVPMGMVGFAIAAIACRSTPRPKRVGIIVAVAVVGFSVSISLRGGGVLGINGTVVLSWRFSESAESRLVAYENAAEPGQSRSSKPIEWSAETIADWLDHPQWPGFRGADRTATVQGVDLETDWESNPPTEVWRIPVGPGWSSFSVAGELLFTQEQRGAQESVVCYSAIDGQLIWSRGIESRFEDSVGGPGPRGTPTIALGDLFVQGANGHLLRLDGATGEIQWQVDLRKIAGRQPPGWGYAGSPLVIDRVVYAYAGGKGDRGILALDAETGELIRGFPSGDHAYSSPQLCDVAGDPMVAVLSNRGLDLIDPEEMELRCEYRFEESGYRALQPCVVDEDRLLLPSESGTRLIRMIRSDEKWSGAEVWTSRFLKPDFNDLVVFGDHAYGFDGSIFACIDLATGQRAWKRGRYGKGQVLLAADSGLLLVLGELGELILLRANPAEHQELGRFPALEGKTWNHPVLVADMLFVRNSTEAACIRLPVKGGPSNPFSVN